jgi:hypothetical protein
MQTLRYQCRDCAAPIDRSPSKRAGKLTTGHCDCPDAAWVVLVDRAPVKLVDASGSARGGPGFEVLEGRAVVIATETMPPLAGR